MSDLKHSDFSRIRDEDLTPDQRQEIERRFHAFTRALSGAKSIAPEAPVPKSVTKWVPKAAARRA
jgi:hypothetical protein